MADKKLATLDDLFRKQLHEIYHTEQQIHKTLDKLSESARSNELQAALRDHREQTRTHIDRLETIFGRINEKPTARSSPRCNGLIKDCAEIVDEKAEPHVHDAAIIAAVQHVEHDEIASYGTLRSWADTLGHTEEASLLSETLDEEKQADKRLTILAKQLNPEAAARR